MRYTIFGFLFGMWVLMLAGGAVLVVILGPITISGYGQFDWLVSSAIKTVTAIILVILWILILAKFKNWIFKKELRF